MKKLLGGDRKKSGLERNYKRSGGSGVRLRTVVSCIIRV